MLSPCDQTSRRRLGWRPCSYPSCTTAARRQREKEIKSQMSERGKREDTGHVRAFQEEDDEHDGQKVPRRRRRLGAAAGSRFRPQALLRRRRRPAVAGRHEQLPLGSHWIPPSLACSRTVAQAASSFLRLSSGPGRCRVGGEEGGKVEARSNQLGVR